MKEWLASKKDIIKWSAVALVFLALAIFVSVTSAVVVTLFLLALVLHLNNGLPLIIALVFLCISALLVALGQRGAGGTIANWAYYFLAIGVVLQLIDYVRSGEERRPIPPSVDTKQAEDK